MLNLKVNSLKGVVFEGDVEAVTSYNNKGKFDILPGHARFISIIGKEIVIYLDKDKNKKKYRLGEAVLRCADNKINVYLDV